MNKDVLNTLAHLINEMSPYLLLGFLFAGILHVLIPKKFYLKYLSQDNFKSVFLAALFGVPLPLCSCGVIPTAMSLRREGVSKSATISFLTATPQTGIDSILATYAVFGMAFAFTRPFAALGTALLSGVLASLYFRKKHNDDENHITTSSQEDSPQGRKWVQMFKYGYVNMLQDIGGHLVIGLLIAGIITVAVPKSFLVTFSEYPLLEMLIVLLFSIPMYVCATGSIPIAAALLLKGLSQGAALVFLMAGPATNMAAIMVIKKVMGKKSLYFYLIGIIIGAICFGYIINTFLPVEWFFPITQEHLSSHTHTPWWKWASSAIFILLLANAFIQKQITNKIVKKNMEQSTTYKVDGMSCNHCKNSVETNVKKITGVTEAKVTLDKGELHVVGTASEKQIEEVINSLGFKFKGSI